MGVKNIDTWKKGDFEFKAIDTDKNKLSDEFKRCYNKNGASVEERVDIKKLGIKETASNAEKRKAVEEYFAKHGAKIESGDGKTLNLNYNF